MEVDTPLREISSDRCSQDPEVVEEECLNGKADVVRIKGEPVIRTGRDVSHFLVDLRDDGDPALTFRSLVIGTLFACVRAANSQLGFFMPNLIFISSIHLMLLIYITGKTWSKVLPRRSMVDGTRFAVLGPLLEFINHGEFRIKEHAIATWIATSASFDFKTSAELNYVIQALYYNTTVHVMTPVLAGLSVAGFGYGVCGLLQSLTIYSTEMVYWTYIPSMVSILQSLHFHSPENQKHMKLFCTAFAGMFLWQIIPSYIFPLLGGLSVFCLASQHLPPHTQDIFTNIFGGVDINEGLGLFSVCFDWDLITLYYMTIPLVSQTNSWIGYGVCYIVLPVIYYANIWNSKNFPMLSNSMFYSNGSIFDPLSLATTFEVNNTSLNQAELPHLAGSNAWFQVGRSLSIGGMFAHCLCFWGPELMEIFRNAHLGIQPDPHWKAMQKYKEVPFWWYILLLTFSFICGLFVVLQGQITMTWYSYIVALLLGALVTSFSQMFYACLGNAIHTDQLMKLIGGFIHPSQPMGNNYFAMWSNGLIGQSITFAIGMKISQYFKIPPQEAFFALIWGTVLGVIVQHFVTGFIMSSQRTALDSEWSLIWSSIGIKNINNNAIMWSFSKEFYGQHGPYFIVILSLLVGFFATIIQWLISKRWPKIGPVQVHNVILPIIYMYSSYLSPGVNSPSVTSGILVGILSQFWLRNYHPGWFRKYNYILGAALDAGSQVMLFILSFAVLGASGSLPRPFPAWAGNPTNGNVDYCNGNGAFT